jgi:DNA-directed RNA polymerase specialized sigma24 family protein
MLGWSVVEDLYTRHSRSVFRRARALLDSDDAAREVTHAVFRRAARLGGIPSQPSSMAWLYRTTTQLCLDRLHDDKRRRAAAPATPTDAGGARDELHALLDRIPPALQEIAVYFLFDQLTYDEIAAIVSLPPRATRRATRGRSDVGQRLGEFHILVERLAPELRGSAS